MKTEKNKKERPKKENKKSEMIRLRVTPKEKLQFEVLAENMELSVSECILKIAESYFRYYKADKAFCLFAYLEGDKYNSLVGMNELTVVEALGVLEAEKNKLWERIKTGELSK